MPIMLGLATAAWNANHGRVCSSIISCGIIATKDWVLMSAVLIKPDSEVGFALTTLLRMCAREGTTFLAFGRGAIITYLPLCVLLRERRERFS